MTCGKFFLILLCSFLWKTRPRPWRWRPVAKRANREQAACKPGSVTGPEGPADGHSSGTPVAGRLARSTRACRPRMRLPPLFDLAPGGVCPAAAIAGGAVRSYRTLSPLPRLAGGAVCSLWHFPWGRPRRGLPGTVFPWSPDFPPAAGGRPSVRLIPSPSLALAARRVNARGWQCPGLQLRGCPLWRRVSASCPRRARRILPPSPARRFTLRRAAPVEDVAVPSGGERGVDGPCGPLPAGRRRSD